ncbi:MAG TPA: serine hydrolase domain-containing protein [Aridibacter sp.]|nr:serine hydrolase domain-containing protein [Aridibacter sp.]
MKLRLKFKRLNRLFPFLFVLLLASVSCAQMKEVSEGQHSGNDADLKNAVDKYLQEVSRRPEIAGLAVAVTKNGRTVFANGYGEANLEKGHSVTPGTRFQIASVTKPFTAMAVMLLVEDGKIKLDRPAREYLTWLPEKYSRITVRQLLSHTSGVNRDVRDDNLDTFGEVEFRRRLESRPVSFAPGERFEYSNTGYIILGMLVESVSGESYGSFVSKRILEPLGMKDTSYYDPPSEASDRALGYEYTDGKFSKASYFPGGFAAGGMVSSASDMAKFASAISDGKLLMGSGYQEIYSPAKLGNGTPVSLKMGGMFEGEETGYGFGWWLTGYKGRTLLTHGGGVSGFSAILNRYPEEGVSITVLANTKTAGVDRIAEGVADIVLTGPSDK